MTRAAAHSLTRRGDGSPVVVLAHGVGGSQRHWAGVAELLAPRMTVVTYSLSGSPDADPGLFSSARHSSATG